MALGTALGKAYTQIATAPDYSLRIGPLRLELAPGKVIETFGYNGTVPGPVLRLREGRQVSIDIRNDTDIDDIIHWHGLYVPSAADGAMEEGSPMVDVAALNVTRSRRSQLGRGGITATTLPERI